MRKINLLNKITAFTLALLFVFSFAGCKNTDKTSEKDTGKTGTHIATVTVNDSKKFFSNGVSGYKIVLPDSATDSEMTAAVELEYFFRIATSYSLETVTESQFTGQKYFSIGKTKLLERSGISYNDDTLGVSGYKLKSIGDNVYFIGSAGGYGSIYAVYDFLKYTVDYRCYASDEYHIDTKDSVSFYDFDITEVPTIQRRISNDYLTNNDSDLSRRLRFNSLGNDLYTGVHTELQIMPYAEYKDEHSSWYSNGGLHLCYSSGEEFEEAFIRAVEEDLSSNEAADRVVFGLSDYNSFCTCEKCTAAIEKYGTESAVVILFLNDVIPQIQSWLAKNYPDRHVKFQFMAYQRTVEAPATKQTDGTFKANAEELKFVDDFGLIIYDSAISYSKRLDSERNIPRLELLQRWASLTDEIIIGTYAINFYYVFCNYPNYLAMEDNYTIWAENNVVGITEMGNFFSQSTTFQALRNFMMSRFMWNSSLNYQETVKEFMDNYYKEASNDIYEYFTKLCSWQKYIEDENSVDHGYLYFSYNATHWPKEILDSFKASILNAYKSIEPLKETDSSKYELLFNRIKMEELSVNYMYLCWYQGYFTTKQVIEMVDDLEYYCTKFGTTYESEGYFTIFDTIANWRLSF